MCSSKVILFTVKKVFLYVFSIFFFLSLTPQHGRERWIFPYLIIDSMRWCKSIVVFHQPITNDYLTCLPMIIICMQSTRKDLPYFLYSSSIHSKYCRNCRNLLVSYFLFWVEIRDKSSLFCFFLASLVLFLFWVWRYRYRYGRKR